ncbi:hypothetical protein T4C_2727 [Trichinella pseudospiralis]|uniref:Uncharacterized protein n=1 Tax=Trichinella pseudospiralis TaxID=6337 RepID=A0A0V1IP30_TRIPS|nr:hypothetical protein T4C_2727 [Trichinella pseudospiralis]
MSEVEWKRAAWSNINENRAHACCLTFCFPGRHSLELELPLTSISEHCPHPEQQKDMDRANGIFPPENEEEETKLPYKELDMKIRCGVR